MSATVPERTYDGWSVAAVRFTDGYERRWYAADLVHESGLSLTVEAVGDGAPIEFEPTVEGGGWEAVRALLRASDRYAAERAVVYDRADRLVAWLVEPHAAEVWLHIATRTHHSFATCPTIPLASTLTRVPLGWLMERSVGVQRCGSCWPA